MRLKGQADFEKLCPEAQELILLKLTEWSDRFDEHPDRWYTIFEVMSHRFLLAQRMAGRASLAIRLAGSLPADESPHTPTPSPKDSER